MEELKQFLALILNVPNCHEIGIYSVYAAAVLFLSQVKLAANPNLLPSFVLA